MPSEVYKIRGESMGEKGVVYEATSYKTLPGDCLNNTGVMHLSMTLPTPPPPGRVGKYRGIDKLKNQFFNCWGMNIA